MASNDSLRDSRALLDRLVRRQRSKLIAQLGSRLGHQNLSLIEDAVQDALLKAIEKWEFEGIPDNPGAWLYRVTYNRAVDLLRKLQPELEHKPQIDFRHYVDELDDDAEVRLLLYCCQPSLKKIDQQLLMLNLVIGLEHKEIATLLLMPTNTIAAKLSRAKKKTQRRGSHKLDVRTDASETTQDNSLRSGIAVDDHREAVHWNHDLILSAIETLYAAFNVGYFPRQGARLIQHEIAMESLRLTLDLAEKARPDPDLTASLYALAAMMSFHCSRFEERLSETGGLLLLDRQNNTNWNKGLIAQGNKLLIQAKRTEKLSAFHIQAAIAAIHANTPPSTEKDWLTISALYHQLIAIDHSPGQVVSAAIALSHNHQPKEALQLLDDLLNQDTINHYSPYYLARAEILKRMGQKKQAIDALEIALKMPMNQPVTALVEQELIEKYAR